MDRRRFGVYKNPNKSYGKLVIDTYVMPKDGEPVLTKTEKIEIYSRESEQEIIGVIIGKGAENPVDNQEAA